MLRRMKARLTTRLCAVALVLAGTTQAQEQQSAPPPPQKHSVVVKVADAVIVRPISAVSTLVGSTFFVIGLPVTALLKRTRPAADALVINPARATFKRPLGDLDAMAQ